MSEQKTLFFSNIQIYTFYKSKKKKSPFGCASTLCENGNKELEKYFFFQLVDKVPIGWMDIGLLFVQRNEMSPYLQ